MPIETIDIAEFVKLSSQYPVLDVRSPLEYAKAHIPKALSLPLFTDDQRRIIGTAYTQQSRQIAVDLGLGFFSEKMKQIQAEALQLIKDWEASQAVLYPQSSSSCILIHCWRGGMRSGAVAWLLSLYGYRICVLKGGYKAFRRWVLKQFDSLPALQILGGYTGSGKTEVLKELKRKGEHVIDLEGLANHRGSAFGSLGQPGQPSQEMFENLLAIELNATDICIQQNNKNFSSGTLWLEDESRNIGKVTIPNPLWEQMRKSPLHFLEIPFEERLEKIVTDYGQFSKEELVNRILLLQKRLGGANTKAAIDFIMRDKPKDSFSLLLNYYDQIYLKALHNREDLEKLFHKISLSSVCIENADQLIQD